MQTTSAIQTTPISIREVDYLPDTASCPDCGLPRRRIGTAERTALDLVLDGPTLLRVRVGVHACAPCSSWFRAQPPFLRRGATYTNRVVRTAVESVHADGMAIRRVPARMARDFWLRPSEATVRFWCRSFGEGLKLEETYEPWIVNSFSGILCVDEVYQNRLALLLAADPAGPEGDRLVGYQLIHGSVTQPDVEAFLTRLRDAGLHPEQVVSDGSALYPRPLAKVWPEAAHQLCLFHEAQGIVKDLGKVVRATLRNLPTPPRAPKRAGAIRRRHDPDGPNVNDRAVRIALVRQLREEGNSIKTVARLSGHARNTVRSWLRGTVRLPGPDDDMTDAGIAEKPRTEESAPPTPSGPPEPWTSWKEVREFRSSLRRLRYKITGRKSKLSEKDRDKIDQLLEVPAAATLRVLHDFAQDWYAIWTDQFGARRSVDDARTRFEALRADPAAGTVPATRRLQGKMTADHFARLSAFLQHEHWEATSNGAERMARRFRQIQAPHYRLRTDPAIRTALNAFALRSMPTYKARTERALQSTRGRRLAVA